MEPSRNLERTFEETFPLFPFAELVRLAVLLGQRVARARLRHSERRGSLADLLRPEGRRLSPR